MTGVSKSYRVPSGTVNVFRNLNLIVPDGTITALTAVSGRGKSTLARLLMGIEPWDDGEIYCSGLPLQQIPARELRRRHQFVQQNPLLAVHPLFSISKILAEPLTISGVPKDRIKRLIQDIMEMLELSPTLLNRLPGELSGGELQRVTLGRALLMEPEYIIMDEPFSALDPKTATLLTGTLKKILGQAGSGALLLSPRPGLVSDLADLTIQI